MRSNPESPFAHVTDTLTKRAMWLTARIRDRMEMHKRRLAEEQEFYRKLRTYCRANRVSAYCEDDWKMNL